MADNQQIAQLLEAFKGKGYVKTAKELGKLMGENANGFSDIQAGRKKLTLEHVINMKKSHPDFNTEWIITGQGGVFLELKGTDETNDSEKTALLKSALAELREQLAFLRVQNSDLTKALLKGEVVKQG
jgi:hypothetical protein